MTSYGDEMKIFEQTEEFKTGFIRNRSLRIVADTESQNLIFSIMSTRNGGKRWESEFSLPVPLDNLGPIIHALQSIQKRLNLA